MASVKPRPGYGYEVRYIDPATGKRPSKTFKLKKDADAFRRKVEREIEDGIHVAAGSTATVAEMLREFMAYSAERLRDGRIGKSHYLRTELVCRLWIEPNVGGLPAKDLSIDAVAKLYGTMVKGGVSPLSARHYLHVFRMAEQFARKRGWMKTQPVTDALSDLRGLPATSIETFTPSEVSLLLKNAAVRGDRGRHRASAYRECIVSLGALCGMRMGEILGLRVQDVDLATRTIRVRQNLTKFRETKGPKTVAGRRNIHLPSRAAGPIGEWLTRFHVDNAAGLIFTTPSGGILADANVRRDWLALLTRLGLATRHFHALRHFHASWLLKHGMPVAEVSKILGHSSHDMTLRVYTHAMMEGAETADRIEHIAGLLPSPDAPATQMGASH